MRLAALVLAGGRGSRMGADRPKPLILLGGRTLLAWVLDAVPGEADPVLVNANETAGFALYGLPIVADSRTDFPGPLAGIEAAARSPHLRGTGTTHLLVLPGDTPFLTEKVLRHLLASPGRPIRVARHAGRLQPTVALWPLEALDGLGAFLDAPGRHAVMDYLDLQGFEPVDIDGNDPFFPDPFFNVNSPIDLAEAEFRLSSG